MMNMEMFYDDLEMMIDEIVDDQNLMVNVLNEMIEDVY
jgi:hypothetical protein